MYISELSNLANVRSLGNHLLISRRVVNFSSLTVPNNDPWQINRKCRSINMAGLGKRQRDETTHQEWALQLSALEAILLSKDTNTAARMNALDLHAKAYIELNNLPAARRDALLMLRTNRTDGRGYVRSAQIERLAGDIPAAVEWYDHGLRRVPETDHLYPYMREERRKTIVLSRPTDPVTVLPEEVLEFVLSFLEYRDISRSLQVSKLWNTRLSTIRPMSDTVDFRLCSGIVSTASLDIALKRVRKSAKTLHFANLSDAARRLLKSRLDVYADYPKLQTLSLNGWGLMSLPFSRYPLKSIQITDSSGLEMAVVVNILKTCKELEIAKFTNVLVPGKVYPDPILVQDFKKGVIISNVLKVLHISCEVGDMVLDVSENSNLILSFAESVITVRVALLPVTDRSRILLF
jgi:hypothetical protein